MPELQLPAQGTPYSISVYNASSIDDQNAIVFQQQPDQPSDVHSLAWLTKMCHAETWARFRWTLDFNFVWGQSGVLRPGVNYDCGQSLPANLTDSNMVTLAYVEGGFKFANQRKGPYAGSLYVAQGEDVPGFGSNDQGCVGIGMSGAGTFVTLTQSTGAGGVQFEIHPRYWVGFGRSTPGEVVTTSVLTYPEEIDFPVGAFHADCTFTGRSWEIAFSESAK